MSDYIVDYEWIKQEAKRRQCRVDELIVLAPQNDPFYTGTPSDHAKARWFADLWERFGYTSGVHLRRIHYRLVSDDPPVMGPDGRPYENTDRCWSMLGTASKAARYLGLVDAGDFDDRRNPDPIVCAQPETGDPEMWVHGDVGAWQTRLPDFPDVPRLALDGYAARQPYLLEIWCEKSTMNDVLEPLCRRYGANLVTALGEFSVTAVLAAAKRIKQDGRPTVLLYISDFDPAGKCMPVSVARKMEYFVRELGLSETVRLEPVALTEEQCREYRLPRTPIKESELRRGGFEERYGQGATELDALEALHPGVLANILRQAMWTWYDADLERRVREAQEELEEAMQDSAAAVMENHQDEVDALRQEYEQLTREYVPRLADFHERRNRVWRAISEEMARDAPAIDDYPVPEPEQASMAVEPLYDSTRTYIEQLGVYRGFQGRTAPEEESA